MRPSQPSCSGDRRRPSWRLARTGGEWICQCGNAPKVPKRPRQICAARPGARPPSGHLRQPSEGGGGWLHGRRHVVPGHVPRHACRERLETGARFASRRRCEAALGSRPGLRLWARRRHLRWGGTGAHCRRHGGRGRHKDKEVAITIPHKTAQGGQTELTPRTLWCACGARVQPLCPVHAAARHVIRRAGAMPNSPFLPAGDGSTPSKAYVIDGFTVVLNQAGVATTSVSLDGGELRIFGGHMARVEGAQFVGGYPSQPSPIVGKGRHGRLSATLRQLRSRWRLMRHASQCRPRGGAQTVGCPHLRPRRPTRIARQLARTTQMLP